MKTSLYQRIILLGCFLFVLQGSIRLVHSAHPSGLDKLKSKDEKRVFSEVVEMWDSFGSLGRGPGTIYETRPGKVQARIDLQGLETHDGVVYERFNAQIGGNSYAAVHLQRGVRFGIGIIRAAFEQSQDHGAHVFFTGTDINSVQLPNDKLHYVHKDIHRKYCRTPLVTRVWSVEGAVNYFRKYDRNNR